jgi:hypothetical protein
MGIPMGIDLDTLGGIDPLKYPPFPEAAWGELLRPFKRRPTAKTLAVLAQASIYPPTLEDSLPLRYRL